MCLCMYLQLLSPTSVLCYNLSAERTGLFDLTGTYPKVHPSPPPSWTTLRQENVPNVLTGEYC